MFHIAITLLILISVVLSYLLLERLIIRNFERDREFIQERDNQLKQIIKDFSDISESLLDTAQLLVGNQNILNSKMSALTTFMDDRNGYVTFQQEQFDTLAKADMLAARREELLRTKELKVALERLMGVAMTSRQPPAPNDVLAIENLTNRIKELEAILEEGGTIVT